MSEHIHRRPYERKISSLCMPPHYYGFSNRILVQQKQSTTNLFIPIYVILKIKSIQGVDIKSLSGSLNAVFIINVLVEDLPEPLIYLLKEGIELQINRSELLFLKESRQDNILLDSGKRMLKFTIRRTLTATIMEDTLWSPFEIIRLIISFTFNSIKKEGVQILQDYNKYLESKKKIAEKNKMMREDVKNIIMFQSKDLSHGMLASSKKKQTKRQISFNEWKSYIISFNCMRNGLEIPISYALGCVYSLYDLAESRLQAYYTKEDSYTGVIEKYNEQHNKKQTTNKKKKKHNKNDQNKKKNKYNSKDQSLKDGQKNKKKSSIKSEFNGEWDQKVLEVDELVSSQHLGDLSLNVFNKMFGKTQKKQKKQKDPKAKYYQYVHFVVPLYKYPLNSLATIYIPVFLLSLLSLAIFFQENNLSDRIGSIATMVLGYIALIPSIKQQLPPSSKMPYIQIVIYISTLCCMLSLMESFIIDHQKDYVFVWWQSYRFLICLIVHSSIFLMAVVSMLFHKWKWEPSYNLEVQARMTDPEKNPEQWINFYCDQEFYQTNNNIYQTKKTRDMIQKYHPTYVEQIKSSEQNQRNTQVDEGSFLSSILQPNKKFLSSTSAQDQKSILHIRHTTSESIIDDDRPLESSRSNKIERPRDVAFKKKKESGYSNKESGQQERKDEKDDSKVLFYQKMLDQIDKLISEGKHITWTKANVEPTQLETAKPKQQ